MQTITIDFLRNYTLGTRREADSVAYQYDEGHILNARIPTEIETATIEYWIRGLDAAQVYEAGSITEETDGTYTVAGNIPNELLEACGDLRVYIVATDNSASIVTYEGLIRVTQREIPDTYVSQDPTNAATRLLTEAEEAAERAEEAAEIAVGAVWSASDPNNDGNVVLTLIEEV